MLTIKHLRLLGLLLLFCGSLNAQNNSGHVHDRTCASHTVLQQQLQQDPARRQMLRQIEDATQRYVNSVGTARATQTRTIPVYVHVIYNTSQENISAAQIQSQIDVLNLDYSGQNADLANVPSIFQSATSSNPGIQYSLVSISRKQSSRTVWGTADDMKKASQGGVNPITPNTHLNIWVCKIGGGVLGYAQFPGGSASTDGVVIAPKYFGSSAYDTNNSFYLAAPYDKGRTAVHEVGHYLNLRHIWGDGNCSVDDYVGDTPKAGGPNYNCPSAGSNSCGGGLSDMFMNYMDYVNDDCMFMFSKGQVSRMWATLNGSRANLGTNSTPPPANCTGTEVVLNLNFDNYASETSWQLKNASGQVVYSGSGYANGATSISETFCLADGCYDFVISDSYGDGICCSYGNGSYALVDGSTTLASGASFTSSQTKQICVSSSSCHDVNLALNFDNYASETSWAIKNTSGTTVESGSGYANGASNIAKTFCLPTGCYTFEINDSYGDGICCSYGNGSYSVTNNGSTLASGASFAKKEVKSFCVGGATARIANEVVANDLENYQPVMNIFPNPALQYITVELLNTQEASIGSILDATGKKLWQGTVDAGQNDISLQNIPAGLYYFTAVQSNGKTITKKFVKI